MCGNPVSGSASSGSPRSHAIGVIRRGQLSKIRYICGQVCPHAGKLSLGEGAVDERRAGAIKDGGRPRPFPSRTLIPMKGMISRILTMAEAESTHSEGFARIAKGRPGISTRATHRGSGPDRDAKRAHRHAPGAAIAAPARGGSGSRAPRGARPRAARATLGDLSASLAHEITQPLSAIAANAHAARRMRG